MRRPVFAFSSGGSGNGGGSGRSSGGRASASTSLSFGSASGGGRGGSGAFYAYQGGRRQQQQQEDGGGCSSMVSLPPPLAKARDHDELARCWWWVREADELSRVMQDGQALHGFVEQWPCFPPSFRWVKGARADYSREGVEAFDGCYTLRKEGGGRSLRPPSYTDRVLVHSLPDLAEDLDIEGTLLRESVCRCV